MIYLATSTESKSKKHVARVVWKRLQNGWKARLWTRPRPSVSRFLDIAKMPVIASVPVSWLGPLGPVPINRTKVWWALMMSTENGDEQQCHPYGEYGYLHCPVACQQPHWANAVIRAAWHDSDTCRLKYKRVEKRISTAMRFATGHKFEEMV